MDEGLRRPVERISVVKPPEEYPVTPQGYLQQKIDVLKARQSWLEGQVAPTKMGSDFDLERKIAGFETMRDESGTNPGPVIGLLNEDIGNQNKIIEKNRIPKDKEQVGTLLDDREYEKHKGLIKSLEKARGIISASDDPDKQTDINNYEVLIREQRMMLERTERGRKEAAVAKATAELARLKEIRKQLPISTTPRHTPPNSARIPAAV